MEEVFAFIDGFNVYHHLEAHNIATGENLKWLNYPTLIGALAKKVVPGENIYFFTAQPFHVSSAKQDRYRLFCKAQKMMGVQVLEGRFKQNITKCKSTPCGEFKKYPIHQEKQTDVNIGVKLIEMAHKNPEGRFYLITADTDQIPTARMMKNLFPKARFFWVSPHNKTVAGEIRQLLNRKQILSLRWKYYRENQMPVRLTVNGQSVTSPYAKKEKVFKISEERDKQ